MRKFPFSVKEFEYIYSRVPKVSVELVISVGKGVVLAKRDHVAWKGLWYIPGGTVYYREALKDACLRVGQEELGVDVEVVKFLDYVEFFSEEKARGFGYSIAMDFLCRTHDKLPEKSLEGEELKVFFEVPEMVVPEHGKMLERYFRGEFVLSK